MAHNGPPFPILEKHLAGPYLLSIWADPDVGVGTFYIFLDPAGGKTAPAPSVVKLSVRPVTERLPWVEYPAQPGTPLGKAGYVALPHFDQEEKWRIRVAVTSPAGNAGADAEVMVTPQGPSLAEFFLYLLPFLAVGFLWIRAFLRGRQSSPPAAS